MNHEGEHGQNQKQFWENVSVFHSFGAYDCSRGTMKNGQISNFAVTDSLLLNSDRLRCIWITIIFFKSSKSQYRVK